MTRPTEPAGAWAAAVALLPPPRPLAKLRSRTFLAVLASATFLSGARAHAEKPSPPSGPVESPSPKERGKALFPTAGKGEREGEMLGPLSDPGSVEEEGAEVKGRRGRFLPHYEYLEDSYLDYFYPNVGPVGDSPLAMEAQLAAHLFLVNQWDEVERTSPPGSMASVLSWDLSFILKMRVLREPSDPVRPPSYLPSTHLQWFGLFKTQGGDVQEIEAEGALAHHSNGQEQCSFVPESEQGTASPTTCLSPGQTSGSLPHQVNYRSGDFTTSYGTIGLHYAYMTLDWPHRYPRSRVSVGIRYEQDFVTDLEGRGFPGAIHPDQAWVYGIHRVNLSAQGRRHFFSSEPLLAGVGAATLTQEFMWNTALGVPNTRTILEMSYLLDGLNGVGLFVRGYTGQDYMNILYAAGRTTMFQFGLIWSMSPEVRYRFGEGRLAR